MLLPVDTIKFYTWHAITFVM